MLVAVCAQNHPFFRPSLGTISVCSLRVHSNPCLAALNTMGTLSAQRGRRGMGLQCFSLSLCPDSDKEGPVETQTITGIGSPLQRKQIH